MLEDSATHTSHTHKKNAVFPNISLLSMISVLMVPSNLEHNSLRTHMQAYLT